MVARVVDDSWRLLHWHVKRDLALFQSVQAHWFAGGPQTAED
jgi:hypothetical protein